MAIDLQVSIILGSNYIAEIEDDSIANLKVTQKTIYNTICQELIEYDEG